MTGLFLARATLRRDKGLAALAPLLIPEGEGGQAGAAHRLVWTLFADGPERRRDFLWRQIAPGRFLLLGPRPPEDPNGLFALESKPFAPELSPGQRLRFDLRVNATVSVNRGPDKRGRREGLLAHHLRAVPPPERAAAARAAALGWLQRQGGRAGFAPDPDAFFLRADESWRVPRGKGSAQIAVLDLEGECTVSDPALFLAALGQGFGHARGFGCGLMLIGPPRG